MREHTSDAVFANKIRMLRSSLDVAFLVVEGRSDKLVYERFVDREGCMIVVACGRETILGAIRILNGDKFSGVLGIVDADFVNLTGETIPEDNILSTDLHDLECMMLDSPAFDRILEEFASAERVTHLATTNPLMARQFAAKAAPLGCLRLISFQGALKLKFKELTFSKFVEASDPRIDTPKMVRAVVNNTQKHDLDQTRLVEQVEIEMRRKHDCWQISCGHDIVEILSLALRKILGSKSSGQVAADILEKSLRLAYEFAYFKETKLYRAMVDWEQHHPNFPILDRST